MSSIIMAILMLMPNYSPELRALGINLFGIYRDAETDWQMNPALGYLNKSGIAIGYLGGGIPTNIPTINDGYNSLNLFANLQKVNTLTFNSSWNKGAYGVLLNFIASFMTYQGNSGGFTNYAIYHSKRDIENLHIGTFYHFRRVSLGFGLTSTTNNLYSYALHLHENSSPINPSARQKSLGI